MSDLMVLKPIALLGCMQKADTLEIRGTWAADKVDTQFPRQDLGGKDNETL